MGLYSVPGSPASSGWPAVHAQVEASQGTLVNASHLDQYSRKALLRSREAKVGAVFCLVMSSLYDPSISYIMLLAGVVMWACAHQNSRLAGQVAKARRICDREIDL